MRPLCAVHARAYESGRRTKGGRYTDRAWRKLRADYLQLHPWCMQPRCHEPSTDVDHILPRARGGTDHENNLQALCHSCHSRKTVKVDGGFGNVTATTHHPWGTPDVAS